MTDGWRDPLGLIEQFGPMEDGVALTNTSHPTIYSRLHEADLHGDVIIGDDPHHFDLPTR